MSFEYPNGPQDKDGILRYRDDIRQANRSYWQAVELKAWENILFYIGKHWIEYSNALAFWRPMVPTKKPRPVTNRVKSLVNDLSSKLVSFKPPITWGPGSDADADYVAASVADRVNMAIEKEADIRTLKPIGARWLGTTGNLFVLSGYNNSMETGKVSVQAERCLACGEMSMPKEIEASGGLCPFCQANQFAPAVNEMGLRVGQEYPRGRHMIELANVFTMRFDPQVDLFSQSPYYKDMRSRDKAWVVEKYGDAFAETVSYAKSADPSSTLYDSLAFTSMGHSTLGTGGGMESNRATVERIWIRPHETKAPGGIYAVVVGDTVAESGEYPYHNERHEAMLNIVHIQFDQVPGRALGASRVDDVVPLNRELNEIDACIALHNRRMANSLIFAPKGVGMSRISGEAGLMVTYDALAGVPAPHREQGLPIPPHLLQQRESKKQEMNDVFGMPEISRGEAPGGGIRAYASLAMMAENAQQGLSNVLDNWALGWMDVSRQGINIWREYADETRTISLGIGRWATQKFSKAEMIGGVDMDCELGMNRPTSMVAKAARIGQARMDGLINVFDPQVRFMALKALGIPELMPDFNEDYEKAGRVLDQILSCQDATQLPRPPQPFDRHEIHLFVLGKFEKKEAFESLEPWRQQAILLRAQIHYQYMQQNMTAQMSGSGQNVKEPGGGGAPADGGESKGVPSVEKQAMDRESQGASPDGFSGVPAAGELVGAGA
jgi:hypothetical protein